MRFGGRFHLGARPACDLPEYTSAQRIAQCLKLRLLVGIEQRLDLPVKGHADTAQLLEFLRASERGVRLERLQLIDLVGQDRE